MEPSAKVSAADGRVPWLNSWHLKMDGWKTILPFALLGIIGSLFSRETNGQTVGFRDLYSIVCVFFLPFLFGNSRSCITIFCDRTVGPRHEEIVKLSQGPRCHMWSSSHVTLGVGI